MLAPFLFVGLGGSGGKTLRTIRHELERSLHDSGWGGDFPKAWQFLHIDVPVVADGNDPDLPPQLPPTQYVSLGSGQRALPRHGPGAVGLEQGRRSQRATPWPDGAHGPTR